MNKEVWIAMRHVPYEGDDILGVFSNEKASKECAKKAIEEFYDEYHSSQYDGKGGNFTNFYGVEYSYAPHEVKDE